MPRKRVVSPPAAQFRGPAPIDPGRPGFGNTTLTQGFVIDEFYSVNFKLGLVFGFARFSCGHDVFSKSLNISQCNRTFHGMQGRTAGNRIGND